MSDWIFEERERLLKQLSRTTWKAIAITTPLMAALGLIAYAVIVTQFDLLPGAENTLAILIFAMAVLAGMFTMIGIRKLLWERTVSSQAEQLRSQQFLTHLTEAVGPAAMRSLSVLAKAQVDQALERERQGERATAKEYAEALRFALLLTPER